MKKQITLRIDEDVLDWFKSGGRGYQGRINSVLRDYIKPPSEMPTGFKEKFFKPMPKK